MVPEIHITDENPPIFDLEWMDQCVDKVHNYNYSDDRCLRCLPYTCFSQIQFSGPGVDDLLADVNKQLSFKVRGEFSNKYRQQAILELLGQDFARLHFPHHQVGADISPHSTLFCSVSSLIPGC